MNNNSCTFENDEPNVVAFYNDMQITEVVDFPAGAMITSRYEDVDDEDEGDRFILSSLFIYLYVKK